jgi:antitoxin (DNA-binding transcriptional repressor) of toxin-antitoxin stability system
VTYVGVLEASNNLSTLIKMAAAGEEVVIASQDAPGMKLTPVEELPPAGSPARILMGLASLPPRPPADHEEIERGIQEQRDSWD